MLFGLNKWYLKTHEFKKSPWIIFLSITKYKFKVIITVIFVLDMFLVHVFSFVYFNVIIKKYKVFRMIVFD